MKNPIEMLHDLMRAGEYVFWITMLFMYFCRPVSDDIRYSGFFRNPNIEAAFASAAFILFLVELDNCILQKKIDGKCVFYCVGIILAFDRVNRSDGRTGQLALIAAFLFFCIHNLHYVRKNHTFRSGIMIFLLCSFLFIPISETNNWLLHNLADKFGTEVVYPTDQNYLTAGIRNETIVYAEEINDTELVLEEELNNKLEGRREVATLVSSASLGNALEAYSSGRTLYYLAYIRQMNLFGHYYHAKNWGDYIYPHNGLLEIMYRYGIFSAVPYVIMMISSFWRALLYATGKNSRKRYKLYPILITIGAGCTFLLENGEKPFVWLIWILFYLGQGILFTEDRYRKRMLYEGGKSHGAE